MGIKFNCPNGHKLNVKSFLAGKKGVCPRCGASFRIPSDQPADGDDADAGGEEALAEQPAAAEALPADVKTNGTPATPAAVAVAVRAVGPAAPATIAQAYGAIPQGNVPQAGIPQAGIPQGSIPQGAAVPAVTAVSVAPGQSLGPPGAIDPIAEAPLAAWYVRPPSGGQFGPARGDVMRKWIVEGRVSGDSLVWREGWTDWRGAGQLFPTLANSGGEAAFSPVPEAPHVAANARGTPKAISRKRGNGPAIAAVVILGLLCIGLVVALVYVLFPVQ